VWTEGINSRRSEKHHERKKAEGTKAGREEGCGCDFHALTTWEGFSKMKRAKKEGEGGNGKRPREQTLLALNLFTDAGGRPNKKEKDKGLKKRKG